MNEKIFFEDSNIKITNACLTIRNFEAQTFPLGNITSIKTKKNNPGCLSAIGKFMAVMFGLGLLVGSNNPEFSNTKVFIFFAIGLAMININDYDIIPLNRHHIVLGMGTNEVEVLSGFRKEYLEQIITVINRAIEHKENHIVEVKNNTTEIKNNTTKIKEDHIKTDSLSIADELKKLSELRNAGVLSESEFQQQKEKLLG